MNGLLSNRAYLPSFSPQRESRAPSVVLTPAGKQNMARHRQDVRHHCNDRGQLDDPGRFRFETEIGKIHRASNCRAGLAYPTPSFYRRLSKHYIGKGSTGPLATCPLRSSSVGRNSGITRTTRTMTSTEKWAQLALVGFTQMMVQTLGTGQ